MGVEYSGRREGAAVNIFAIHKKIALLRARLLESGEKYGLLAPQTVLLSQELDRLVVLVQKKVNDPRL
jgi:hypothetical protein